MAGITSKLTRLLVGAAMGAGAVGVILALAGVHSPIRTVLVLLFLAVAPTAAIAGLLGSFDPFARLILAVVTSIAVLSIVAMILLSAGLWSPIGELIGVAVITVICLVAQVPSVRARVAAWAGPRWRALLQRIPAARTLARAPGPAPAGVPAGVAAGNGHATPHGTEAETPGTAPPEVGGEAEAAEAQVDAVEVASADLNRADPDGAENTAEAKSAGPTEVTTPLPAIHIRD
jgi:hypothetical protein